MVARAGGYYGMAFQGEIGVTQGNPFFPTIFNVVMDAVVRHWMMGVIAEEEAQGGAWERREGIRQRYFMPTMAWLPCHTLDGYRAYLTPWSACLTGWACGKMSVRQSTWSVTSVSQQGT